MRSIEKGGAFISRFEAPTQAMDVSMDPSPISADPDAPETSPLWRIELFGGPRAIGDGKILTKFQTHKTAALLAYLAHHLRRTHGREELMGLIWSEGDYYAVSNRFRQALWALRRQLEPPGTEPGSAILADKYTVRLNPRTVQTDVHAFENALAHASKLVLAKEKLPHLKQAVDLYRGEFLPSFYEEWVEDERQRLAYHYGTALDALSAAYEQTGETGAAIDCAQRVIALDPYAETAHCRLIRLLLAGRHYALAVQQFETLEKVSRHSFQGALSLEAEALRASVQEARSLAAEPVAVVSSTASSPPQPHLPVRLSRFFGREKEQTTVRALLAEETRLVTLLGAGGCGKTRLALELGRALNDAFQGRVYFVPLADLTEAWMIPSAILEALLPNQDEPRSGTDPIRSVVEALEPLRKTLVILDNFEHLAEEGALYVRQLLDAAPELSCLITSRHRLRLEGEREVAIRPLETPPIPQKGRRPSSAALQALPEFSSVQMFLDRAQAVSPTFLLTPENAETIAQLCNRLEGIPLAIELAAAWASTLSPQEILERLSNRLDLLVSKRKDAIARHRSLRSAIDGSYELLGPDPRRLLTTLAVFRGSWTHEAALRVWTKTTEIDPEAWPEQLRFSELLEELQSKALILTDESHPGATMRFRMLETLRDYALEKLSPEDAPKAFSAHAEYFLAYAGTAELELRKSSQVDWLRSIDQDLDNFRSAIRWSLEKDDGALGLRIADALYRYWDTRGLQIEARQWCQQCLERVGRAGLEPYWIANGLLSIAYAHLNLGDLEEGELALQEAMDLFVQIEDRFFESTCLMDLGTLRAKRGDYAGQMDYLAQSRVLAEALGDESLLLTHFDQTGICLSHLERHEEALDALRQALLIANRQRDLRQIGYVSLDLAEATLHARSFDACRHHANRGLEFGRQLRDGYIVKTAQILGALQAHALGRPEALLQTALPLLPSLDRHFKRNRELFFTTLFALGVAAIWQGAPAPGLLTIALARRRHRETGLGLQTWERDAVQAVLSEARGTLGDARLEELLRWGEGLTLREIQRELEDALQN